jgi:ATP synthase assembly factor FMC1
MYATLLERYNPGMNMDEEERVKLTARRVGMDLPEEYYAGAEEGSGKDGKGR